MAKKVKTTPRRIVFGEGYVYDLFFCSADQFFIDIRKILEKKAGEKAKIRLVAEILSGGTGG